MAGAALVLAYSDAAAGAKNSKIYLIGGIIQKNKKTSGLIILIKNLNVEKKVFGL